MLKKNKIWLIAGEESGDEFAAEIAALCYQKMDSLHIAGMGGKHMKDAGVELLFDSTELGVMGVTEVIRKIPVFKRILNKLISLAQEQKPDIIILVDYPGFNLRLAQKLKDSNIPIFYFISPKVWVRGIKRIPIMAESLDKLFTIFPFEKELFEDYPQLDVQYVGHPLIPLMKKKVIKNQRQENLILLLPGSRFSEVRRLIKPILITAHDLKQRNSKVQFVLSVSRQSIYRFIEKKVLQLAPNLDIKIVCGETVKYLSLAQVALACSGTVTLQALIAQLPIVSIYRMSFLTASYIKWQAKIKYFTLGNIILQREAFAEFFQEDVKPRALVNAIESIMPYGERYNETQASIAEVLTCLKTDFNAFEEVANAIEQKLSS